VGVPDAVRFAAQTALLGHVAVPTAIAEGVSLRNVISGLASATCTVWAPATTLGRVPRKAVSDWSRIKSTTDGEGFSVCAVPLAGVRVMPVIETLNERIAGFAGSVSATRDRKSTRLNSSHRTISYAVFCLKKKK